MYPPSAKKIVMAVKAGGGADPEKNRQLAQVIADAKVNNVPRDVIERQLSKANAATTIGKINFANGPIFPLHPYVPMCLCVSVAQSVYVHIYLSLSACMCVYSTIELTAYSSKYISNCLSMQLYMSLSLSLSNPDFKSSTFEYYGFGGIGFLVNVLTDNDNRAAKDVAFVAKGCSLKQAAANSVAFKFNTKARLSLQSVIDEVSLCAGQMSLRGDDGPWTRFYYKRVHILQPSLFMFLWINSVQHNRSHIFSFSFPHLTAIVL